MEEKESEEHAIEEGRADLTFSGTVGHPGHPGFTD